MGSEMLHAGHGTECCGYQELGEDAGGSADAQEVLRATWKEKGKKKIKALAKPSQGLCGPFPS